MTTTYRATLQPGHEVATSGKAASNVMEVTSTSDSRKFAWAVCRTLTWPARTSYSVNGRGERFPFETAAGSATMTLGGFAGSRKLAENAVRQAVSLGRKPAKGVTCTLVWSEILPLEVVK